MLPHHTRRPGHSSSTSNSMNASSRAGSALLSTLVPPTSPPPSSTHFNTQGRTRARCSPYCTKTSHTHTHTQSRNPTTAHPPEPRHTSHARPQVERYSRHLLLPSFGLRPQERVCGGAVLIVGCGGLGSPAALYLAAAGVGGWGGGGWRGGAGRCGRARVRSCTLGRRGEWGHVIVCAWLCSTHMHMHTKKQTRCPRPLPPRHAGPA